MLLQNVISSVGSRKDLYYTVDSIIFLRSNCYFRKKAKIEDWKFTPSWKETTDFQLYDTAIRLYTKIFAVSLRACIYIMYENITICRYELASYKKYLAKWNEQFRFSFAFFALRMFEFGALCFTNLYLWAIWFWFDSSTIVPFWFRILDLRKWKLWRTSTKYEPKFPLQKIQSTEIAKEIDFPFALTVFNHCCPISKRLLATTQWGKLNINHTIQTETTCDSLVEYIVLLPTYVFGIARIGLIITIGDTTRYNYLYIDWTAIRILIHN